MHRNRSFSPLAHAPREKELHIQSNEYTPSSECNPGLSRVFTFRSVCSLDNVSQTCKRGGLLRSHRTPTCLMYEALPRTSLAHVSFLQHADRRVRGNDQSHAHVYTPAWGTSGICGRLTKVCCPTSLDERRNPFLHSPGSLPSLEFLFIRVWGPHRPFSSPSLESFPGTNPERSHPELFV